MLKRPVGPRWCAELGGGLQVARRRLPHWQLGGSTYFVTFRTEGALLSPAARQAVLSACRFLDGQRYVLWSVVVMPDHVHLLLQPMARAPEKWWSLASILHSLKSYTAKVINDLREVEGPVWQTESYDHIVRAEEELRQTRLYLRENPVRKGLCGCAEEWDALYERPDLGE